jgi:hypothetical protein
MIVSYAASVKVQYYGGFKCTRLTTLERTVTTKVIVNQRRLSTADDALYTDPRYGKHRIPEKLVQKPLVTALRITASEFGVVNPVPVAAVEVGVDFLVAKLPGVSGPRWENV